MMGNTHAITGVLGAAILCKTFGATWEDLAVGAIVVTGASLLPDIDHEGSTVSRSLGPITQGFSWLARTLTGGHRRGTHSLAGSVLLAGVVHVAVVQRGSWWSIVVLTVVLAMLLAAPIRLLKIRGWWDELTAVGLALGAAWHPAVPLKLVPLCIVLGMMIHVLGDMLTKQGCPVLWPMTGRMYRLATFRAGGLAERWFFRPLFIISIPAVVFWDQTTAVAASLVDMLR